MAKKNAAGSVKTQNLEQQDDDDGQQGATITDPATLAQPNAIADRPPKTESEAGPSKKRCYPQANDPDSATKNGETSQWDLDMEERVRNGEKILSERPIPDPRATPTRSPPPDHYMVNKWEGIDQFALSWESTGLDSDMLQWTYNFLDDDPDAIEARVTAKDKQAIIDYLGDWCLYTDWDSLVATFSPLAHLERFNLLLTATVLKNIFENVVRNPFFYLDLGENWDGSGSDLPPPYGIELNKLFQKGLKVSATDANDWRASTIRLFNRYKPYTDHDTPLQAKDITPGTRAYNLRERCIDQFTANILDDSSLISPILSRRELSLNQTRSRYYEIRRVYKNACKMAVSFSLQKAGFEFDENVNQVAPYKMPIRDQFTINRWQASAFNAPGVYKELLEGKRVAMVLWPATWMIEWDVPLDFRKSREEIDAQYPPDYDRCYRDEKGLRHRVISSGVVLVEKDGREGPLEE